jgi:hypothetical protein
METMDLLLALVTAADPVPEPEDVRAGWTAFWIVIAMAVATGLLLWSFTRQLRKTKENAARGAFGPVEQPEATDESENGEVDSPGRR